MKKNLRSKQLRRKGNNNDEPEIRMVTPPPVIITQESGRTLEFELGRMEIPQVQVEEGAEPPPTPNPDQEKVFVSYPFDQSADTLKS